MPRNYNEQSKIDVDFELLNTRAENTKGYVRFKTATTHNIAKQAKLTLPAAYDLVRLDEDSHSFELAMLCHTTQEIVYYVKCKILPDVVLNARPVTQVLLWRTAVIAHRRVTSGIAEEIFRHYLLEHYNLIASDGCQTREGRDFWVRQLGYALYYGEYVYRYHRIACTLLPIVDHDTIIDNSADLWGDDDDYENVLAIIAKDPISL